MHLKHEDCLIGDNKAVSDLLLKSKRSESSLGFQAQAVCKILLIKPYLKMQGSILHPLGLLYVAEGLRKHLGKRIHITILDMQRRQLDETWLKRRLDQLAPDIVGITAMNHEVDIARKLGETVKQWNSRCLTVLGGPCTLHQSKNIFAAGNAFNWVIEGAGDRNFPCALDRYLRNENLGTDLAGFSYLGANNHPHITNTVDLISNLDAYAMPAWDLAEFDAYRWIPTPNPFTRPGRYATIFTSRGCPYTCGYCHDIFTKKFHFRSAESVLEEIELLHSQYGIDEFMVLDDIFNLNKPRLKQIMSEVKKRWKGRLRFSFMNGLRADILDEEVINALADGGTYIVSVAVETASRRLQQLIGKHLDMEKAKRAIELLENRGISVLGFFMLGFPTETPEEIRDTINLALKSPLTMASFFTVVPQQGTSLFGLAQEAGARHLNEDLLNTKKSGRPYRSKASWYERTYEYPLYKDVISATWHFYFFDPKRLIKLLWRWPKTAILRNASTIISWLR
jgi:anaerobic magnesium-protoporphyrin IX monomethyl ester cyclase